ncbi:hypothetical protein [Burkholderia vietnamiensis]|uniref:hypothetical protein n=1 Tax=Burkholderia vietnamiensis TaxID=60552 RepID=UPI001B974708|nr:hypothetical protein [Burkholderia vietnamiensis]MBR8005606.1 hypothetical protein [Burkholderia vietnamiensis]
MIDQAIHAAHITKAREIVVAAVKRMRAAHVNCADLMQLAEQYLHATRAIDHFHAVYDADLEFEPSEQRAIADLANIGNAFLERLTSTLPGYTWSESPAEVISELVDIRGEASVADIPPTRAIVFRLAMQADTVDHLRSALTDVATRICIERSSGHSIRGGVFFNYESWLTVSDHPTHAEYVRELEHWLNRANTAEGGKA